MKNTTFKELEKLLNLSIYCLNFFEKSCHFLTFKKYILIFSIKWNKLYGI